MAACSSPGRPRRFARAARSRKPTWVRRNRSVNEVMIDARGMHAYYGASHVLRGVDFRVGRGETIGLMGRNGMGKTTLLKSVLGLVSPPAGRIRGAVAVDGRDMTGVAPHEIA